MNGQNTSKVFVAGISLVDAFSLTCAQDLYSSITLLWTANSTHSRDDPTTPITQHSAEDPVQTRQWQELQHRHFKC